MRRAVAVLAALLLVPALAPRAAGTPVATSEETYALYGRVFPDPHGCSDGAPGTSPFAKGNVCATDFVQFDEMVQGMSFLEEHFGRFIEVYVLHEDFDCRGRPVDDPEKGCEDFRSAGLPVTLSEDGPLTRDREPLYMVRVTDEEVPERGKEHFVFVLSIHGIERAGVEGGVRAIEDLATWGACATGNAPDFVDCEHPDNQAPHPLLEATPKRSITAEQALRRSVIYFLFPNPDGWNRGDRSTGTQFYQRYNGNGVDLNRDFPEQGWTYRPYTPLSEPETKAFARVLKAIGPKDSRGRPRWTGGIDLHGMLDAPVFSYTLLGGTERPYDKNQRILQTARGAWRDAEKRLGWSPLIKPNDAPPQPEDPRLYGVQWGTIWDTIDYTVTGAFGNWIDSPIGLNADGIDNEMAFSHVSNCGIGSCFDPDIEQLHVDGNKSLIYSMINFSLKPERRTFRTRGRVGYVHNRGVVSASKRPLAPEPDVARLPQQEPIEDVVLSPANGYTHEFEVKGPSDGVYNGGIEVTITCANAQGVGPCALSRAVLETLDQEHPGEDGEERWEVVNSYYNQSPIYVQAGQALHANFPRPGRYRVRIENGEAGGVFSADIRFTDDPGWANPGQVGYRATNMRFWRMLRRFARPGIGRIDPEELRRGGRWRRYDTVVLTNRPYPGAANRLERWVRSGGNLVLTDRALKMLEAMGLVKKGSVKRRLVYAGYINFATAKREVTYEDPLARRIDQPGAAEGSSGDEQHRRQTYEPVPLGYSLNDKAPAWYVEQRAWSKAGGLQRAVGTTGDLQSVSLGEIKLGRGRIRIVGALLPMPTERFYHPYGLADYALTWAGYQLLDNLLTWRR